MDPRLLHADRHQVSMHLGSLDDLVPQDHRVRLIARYVETLKSPALEALYQAIRSRLGGSGAPAHVPAVLLTLWLYATADGIGSARHLARMIDESIVYQWITGGIRINYHTLASFRTENGELLDEFLTLGLAAFADQGLIHFERMEVAHDGLRVRASAGKSSFRRKETLEELYVEARDRVSELKAQSEAANEPISARQQAARQRAAREREERVRQAIATQQEIAKNREKWAGKKHPGQDNQPAPQLPAAQPGAAGEPAAQQEESGGRDDDPPPGDPPSAAPPAPKGGRKKSNPKEARASTTDHEARSMKMANGGYDPAYNLQFTTDVASRLITSVTVGECGSDSGLLAPAMADHRRRCGGHLPKAANADAGFTKLETIDYLEKNDCTVYVPEISKGGDCSRLKSPEIDRWRERMNSEEGKQHLQKTRPQTAELTNAQIRNRGLRQLTVRGRAKALIIALLHAVVHNIIVANRFRQARKAC